MRAGIWSRNDSKGLLAVGDILAEQTRGEEGVATYDAEWQERAVRTLW